MPKEEVGTDGGAKHADDHCGGRIRREAGPDRAQRHLTSGDVNREQDPGVGAFSGARSPRIEASFQYESVLNTLKYCGLSFFFLGSVEMKGIDYRWRENPAAAGELR